MEWHREPQTDTQVVNQSLTKKQRPFNGERTAFQQVMLKQLDITCRTQISLDADLFLSQNLTQNELDLNVECKAIKFLGDNVRENLGLVMSF